MPRCNCGAGTCACSVTPGVGISVKGNGSTGAPYEITNTQGSLGQQLIISDTETVDLALAPSNPDNLTGSWVLTADATLALTDLTDVREDQTVIEGDVPVWREDHWEFEQAGSGALPPGGTDGDVLTRTSALTAVNLIHNPRFAGTPLATLPVGYRWTPSRCTIAADPAVKRHDTGPQSVACTVTAADGAAYITSGAASAGGYLPITPGAVLTTMFSVFPGVGAGGTYFTSVYFFDAAGAAVGSPVGSTAVTCPEGEWTDLRETFSAAPAGATQIRVAIGSAIGLTLGSVFWMAEPLTVVGTYGDPYFDGESLDDGAYTFAWSGTADQSASNRTSLLAVWEEVDGLPPGGADGQVLTKQSGTDGDANWEAVPATAFQVQDTATLDLSLTGSGNLAAPYVLSGTVLGGGGGGGAVQEPIYSTSRRQFAVVPAANNTIVSIPWDTLDYADGITCDAAGIFTIPVAGYYQVNAKVAFSSNNTGKREIRVLLNGTSAVPGVVLIPPVTSASGTNVSFSRLLKLAAGDTLQVQAAQTSGVTLDAASAGLGYNSVDITKIPTLSPGGGGVVVERPVVMSRRQAAVVPVAQSANVIIPWDTEDFNEGFAAPVNGVVIIPQDGYYQINTKITWSGNATGYRQVRIIVSGASSTAGIFTATPNASASAGVTEGYGRLLKLVAGDTVSVQVNHSVAGALDAAGAANYNSFDITKVPQSFSGSAVSTYGERNYSSSRSHGAATGIVNSTWTVIPLDTEYWTDGIPWNVPNTNAFNIPVDGYYQIDSCVGWAFHATGYRAAAIYQNSTIVASIGISPTNPNGPGVVVPATIKAKAGDYITLRGWQSSGTTLALSGGTTNNYLTVTKVPAPVINGAAASGVWGVGELAKYPGSLADTLGREIFIDTKGQLRAKPNLIYTQKYAADLPSTYPLGMSLTTLTGGWATTGGWPYGASSEVVTFLRADSPLSASQTGFQLWARNVGGTASPQLAEMMFRSGSDASGWTPWASFATAPARVNRLKSVAQTLTAAATYYTLTYETPQEPDVGITYAAGVFTFTVAGVYQVNAVQHFSAISGNPSLRLGFIVNGVNFGVQVSGTVAVSSSVALTRSWRFAAGDTLSIQAYSSTAGQAAYGASNAWYSYIDISKISV